MWRFPEDFSRAMLTLCNLHFMNHLWNLTNITCDCTAFITQLSHELIEWACVNHYGGTKTLLEGIWLGNSGMSKCGFNSVPPQPSKARAIRKKKRPPNIFLLGYTEL